MFRRLLWRSPSALGTSISQRTQSKEAIGPGNEAAPLRRTNPLRSTDIPQVYSKVPAPPDTTLHGEHTQLIFVSRIKAPMPPTNSYIPGRYEPIEATGYAGASVGLPLVKPELDPDQDDLCSTSLDEGIRDPSSNNSSIQVAKPSSIIPESCYIPFSNSQNNSGKGSYPTAAQSHQSTSGVPIKTIVQTKEKDSGHQSSNPQLDTTTSISDTREHVTGVSETDRNNQKPRANVVIETTALPVEPGHIAKELFAFCMKAYQSSLPIIIGLDIEKTRAKMQEEMGRLALWGDSYTVSEGELDILFKNSKEKYLKESTIILLCSIAKTLNSCLSILNTHTSQETSQSSNSSATPPHTAQPTSRLILTKVLVGESSGKDLNTKGLYDHHSETKTDARPAMQEAPRANQYSADGLRPEMRHSLQALLNIVQGLIPEIASLIEQDSSDDDGDDDPLDLRLRLSEVVEDIKDSLDSLFDLVPSIDELCLVTEETIAKEHGQTRVSTIEPAEIPTLFEAQAYKINIQDKFPEVEEQLAETLAEVNWVRHRRIREWAENHESKGQVQVTHGPAGTIFTDSGIGSSNFTFQDILPPTQRNPFSDCRSEASATSFGTTNSTMSGGIRIPKAPVPLSPGIIFECPICFKMLRGIDTSILWKKHVLRDLKPYSCLFSSCSEKTTTFESRKAWVAHEFNHHRPQNSSEWRCSGSCGEVYRKRGEFVQHVLRDHLEGTATASDIDEIVDNCRAEAPHGSICCPLCTKDIPETKRSFQRHIGTHMDEIALKALPINFECESNASSRGEDSEGEGIPSASDAILINFLGPDQPHIAIEPGESPLPWSSDIESTNATPLNSREEAIVHSCEICNKTFPRPCDLTKHRKTHERPFKCDFTSCKYHTEGFPTNKECERHQNNIHTSGSKEWKCQFAPCPYKSKRESNCKQHMEKAHQYVYKRMKRNPRKKVQVPSQRPSGKGKSGLGTSPANSGAQAVVSKGRRLFSPETDLVIEGHKKDLGDLKQKYTNRMKSLLEANLKVFGLSKEPSKEIKLEASPVPNFFTGPVYTEATTPFASTLGDSPDENVIMDPEYITMCSVQDLENEMRDFLPDTYSEFMPDPEEPIQEPKGKVAATVGSQSEAQQDSSHPVATNGSLSTLIKDYPITDSGIGSMTMMGSQVSLHDSQSELGNMMAHQSIQAIETHIFGPMSENPDLLEFKDICAVARDRVYQGHIRCLRDLEKFFLNMGNQNTMAPTASLVAFFDAFLGGIQDAWPSVLWFDRIRQNDVPYSEGYFLDARHQYGIDTGIVIVHQQRSKRRLSICADTLSPTAKYQ